MREGLVYTLSYIALLPSDELVVEVKVVASNVVTSNPCRSSRSTLLLAADGCSLRSLQEGFTH